MVPLLGQPGGPSAVSDIDPRVLVAFIEGLLRENEDNAEKVDQMYADASVGLKRDTPAAGNTRAAELGRFLANAAKA